MPVYDYQCPNCGTVFTVLRPMNTFRDPCPCPDCGQGAERVFLTMPAVAGMDAGKRLAIAINERAAHEPRRSHAAGCACCRGAVKSGNAAKMADGAKSFLKARPWMISH